MKQLTVLLLIPALVLGEQSVIPSDPKDELIGRPDKELHLVCASAFRVLYLYSEKYRMSEEHLKRLVTEEQRHLELAKPFPNKDAWIAKHMKQYETGDISFKWLLELAGECYKILT